MNKSTLKWGKAGERWGKSGGNETEPIGSNQPFSHQPGFGLETPNLVAQHPI